MNYYEQRISLTEALLLLSVLQSKDIETKTKVLHTTIGTGSTAEGSDFYYIWETEVHKVSKDIGVSFISKSAPNPLPKIVFGIRIRYASKFNSFEIEYITHRYYSSDKTYYTAIQILKEET